MKYRGLVGIGLTVAGIVAEVAITSVISSARQAKEAEFKANAMDKVKTKRDPVIQEIFATADEAHEKAEAIKIREAADVEALKEIDPEYVRIKTDMENKQVKIQEHLAKIEKLKKEQAKVQESEAIAGFQRRIGKFEKKIENLEKEVDLRKGHLAALETKLHRRVAKNRTPDEIEAIFDDNYHQNQMKFQLEKEKKAAENITAQVNDADIADWMKSHGWKKGHLYAIAGVIMASACAIPAMIFVYWVKPILLFAKNVM